jgi:acetyltransferase-like isoleucine patch superfamily enzyme
VTRGKNIISAISLVTKDIPSDIIASRNPCMVIKEYLVLNDKK